jgi:hypothetical protein
MKSLRFNLWKGFQVEGLGLGFSIGFVPLERTTTAISSLPRLRVAKICVGLRKIHMCQQCYIFRHIFGSLVINFEEPRTLASGQYCTLCVLVIGSVAAVRFGLVRSRFRRFRSGLRVQIFLDLDWCSGSVRFGSRSVRFTFQTGLGPKQCHKIKENCRYRSLSFTVIHESLHQQYISLRWTWGIKTTINACPVRVPRLHPNMIERAFSSVTVQGHCKEMCFREK